MNPRPPRHDGGVDDADLDAMIEQVLARTPRPIDWTRLPAEDAAQTWLDLDDWVRWLTRTYVLDHRDIPPCWYRHGDLVEELTALWTAHRAAYEPTGPATGPADWHHTFAACRTRLQAWAARTGCRHGQHRDPVPPIWAGEPATPDYTDAFLAHVDVDSANRDE